MPAASSLGSVPQLTAGERAVLAALAEHPETTACVLARVAHVSEIVARDALQRFESLGAAVRVPAESSDSSLPPDLWYAPGYPAALKPASAL